jgi:hypothetical protein
MGAAAGRALADYPGPVGDLIHREIEASLISATASTAAGSPNDSSTT